MNSLNLKIDRICRRLALWLALKTGSWQSSRMKMMVIFFFFLSAGINCWLVCGSFLVVRMMPSRVQIPIIPSDAGTTRLNEPGGRQQLPSGLLKRIQSLKQNESLLRSRPGLMDTIKLIEKFYSPSVNK
jgi:hypothetical protein